MTKLFWKAVSALINFFRKLAAWIDHQFIGGSVLERPTFIRNEILKLRAQSADRLSTACFSVGAAGVVAPLFSSTFQHDAKVGVRCDQLVFASERYLEALKSLNVQCTSSWTYAEILLLLLIACIWLIMGFVLHLIGEAFLLKLGDR